ncbi:multidrug effflux MFS transporter [Thalassobaculum sp.]|uniref:multidrug effflux MFS transporter n=1 Tax=Thalassobaculum sp. TaxID=2022740 RepID=UPI0032EF4B38
MSDKPISPPIWILIAATATGPLALNIFVPSMPGLVHVFDTDYATIQLTLTLYLVGVALAQLAYGPLSDRFGRRPAMLYGLAIYAAASLLCAVAWSVETLIVGRILQAIGGCAGMVLGRAIVRDVYERDRAASAIALITMAMAVAPAIAPTLGGYLETGFGWHATFLAPMVMGLIVLAASFRGLNETNLTPIPRIDVLAMLRHYGELLRSRAFIGYAGNSAMSVGAFFAFLAGAPYVVIEILHRPPGEYGLYFVLISVGYMVGNFGASRLSQRLGVDRMIPLGVASSTVGGLISAGFLLADVITPASVFLPMMLVAVGNGLSQPNSIAGAISVNPRIAGAASGLMGFGQMTVGALFTVIVGHLQNDHDHAAMAGMILFSCVASYLFYRLAKSDRTAS